MSGSPLLSRHKGPANLSCSIRFTPPISPLLLFPVAALQCLAMVLQECWELIGQRTGPGFVRGRPRTARTPIP